MLEFLTERETQTDRQTAILLLNQKGDIVDAHNSCSSAIGWEREELVGKSVTVLLQCGRDLLLTRLLQMEDDNHEPTGDTEFTLQVLVKKKGGAVFPARVTVRRFLKLGCWTAAFLPRDSSNSLGSVTPQANKEQSSEEHLSDNEPSSRQYSSAASVLSKSLWPTFRSTSLLVPSNTQPTSPVRNQEEVSSGPLGSPGYPETEITGIRFDAENDDCSASERLPIDAIAPGQLDHDRTKNNGSAESADMMTIADRASSLNLHFQTLLREVNQTFEAERAHLQRIQALEQRETLWEAQIAEIKDELASARNAQCSAEAQIEALLGQNASLRVNRGQLEAAKNALHVIQTDVEAQLVAARSQLQDARVSLQKLTIEKQELELQLASLQSKFQATCEDFRLATEKLNVAINLQQIEQGLAESDSAVQIKPRAPKRRNKAHAQEVQVSEEAPA